MLRVIASSVSDVSPGSACVREIVRGEGVIVTEPERKEGGQVFVIDALTLSVASTSDMCGASMRIRVKAPLYPRFAYGDRVAFTGRISEPFNFTGDAGRTFDYRGYLAKEDIYYEIKSGHASMLDGMGESWIGHLHAILFTIRRGFVGNLERALGEPHAALAAGLVVGEKAALGKDLLDAFRVVGLIHIVVLSGYNITIVGDALRRLLSFLPRGIGIIAGGVGIVLFGMLVGGGATVVRSCFMAVIALSADVIRRDYQVARALAFAGICMIIINPLILLHDPSFQLSFLATLGLILLAKPLEGVLLFVPEAFGMRGIVACTLATQIFVSPFILHMMGQISLIGMIVNILVLPCVPLTMLMVSLTGGIGFVWPWAASIPGWAAHMLLSYELFMVDTFARVPYASVTVPSFSFWWVVGFYVAFFAVLYIVRKAGRMRSNCSEPSHTS